MLHILFKNTSEWVLPMRQHAKFFLVEIDPPQSWPWKQNGTVVAIVMILTVANNWRSVLQINNLKSKLDFEP